MGPLSEYVVVQNGVETTMQLDEQHARLLGGRPISVEPVVVDVEPDPGYEDEKNRTPANKAMTPPNKATRRPERMGR